MTSTTALLQLHPVLTNVHTLESEFPGCHHQALLTTLTRVVPMALQLYFRTVPTLFAMCKETDKDDWQTYWHQILWKERNSTRCQSCQLLLIKTTCQGMCGLKRVHLDELSSVWNRRKKSLSWQYSQTFNATPLCIRPTKGEQASRHLPTSKTIRKCIGLSEIRKVHPPVGRKLCDETSPYAATDKTTRTALKHARMNVGSFGLTVTLRVLQFRRIANPNVSTLFVPWGTNTVEWDSVLFANYHLSPASRRVSADKSGSGADRPSLRATTLVRIRALIADLSVRTVQSQAS